MVFSIDSSSTGTGSITGSVLTVTGAGNIVIDANQAGNANYNVASQEQQTLVVNKANQTINFTQPTSPIGFVPNETVTLSATGGTSGNPVVFSVDSSSTGTGSITGSVLTVTGAGNIVIDANQAGNTNYNAAAQAQHTLVVVPGPALVGIPGATVVLGTGVKLMDSATLSGPRTRRARSLSRCTARATTSWTPRPSRSTVMGLIALRTASFRPSPAPTNGSPVTAATPKTKPQAPSRARRRRLLSGQERRPSAALYLVGGNTNDQVTIQHIGASSTGSTGIQVLGKLNGVTLSTLTYTQPPMIIYIIGFNGNDTISMESTLAIAVVLTDGNGNENIQLGQGNNTVTVGNGTDTVQAGNGNNVVVANTGGAHAHITLGNGNNTVTVADTTAGQAIVAVGNGNNTLTAGNGNSDQLSAGDGNNTLTAGNGNSDSVQLGKGNNTVRLGNGTKDQVNAGDGSNSVTAGNGNNDLVQLGKGNNTVTFGNGNNDQIDATDGSNNITAGNGSNDIVKLGKGNNTVTLGNGNNDQIDATDGSNNITAGNGSDDIVKLGKGNNTVTLGNGSNDTVDATDGNNDVTVGNGNDTVDLGNGNNVVVAGTGKNTIQAGNGDNLIVGGLGKHTSPSAAATIF